MNLVQEHATTWSTTEKVIFRFFFLFFLLYMIVFNNGAYPFFNYVMMWPTDLLQKFVPWFARHVLHLSYEITVFTNGSGDTTYDYICLLLVAMVSLAGCLVWSVADRRRTRYERLYYWLTVAVRFYVGLMLINYGLVKVFKSQFPSPGLARLTQPYGSSSPMGLAWTFLGFSNGYNLFMGIAEVAAILLLFRRTVAVGAIICLMTTANVMAVNYFYDVPVKIVSTMLFVLTVFLLSPNFKRLFGFFFKGNLTNVKVISIPRIQQKWLRYTAVSVKVLMGVYLLLLVYECYSMYQEYGDDSRTAEKNRPPLYGAYTVLSYKSSKDGVASDDLSKDMRWRQLVVEWPEYAIARLVADTNYGYSFKPDTVKKQIAVNLGQDTVHTSLLQYDLRKDTLTLHGKLGEDSVWIRLARYDKQHYRLINRGFHWINEYPYNR